MDLSQRVLGVGGLFLIVGVVLIIFAVVCPNKKVEHTAGVIGLACALLAFALRLTSTAILCWSMTFGA